MVVRSIPYSAGGELQICWNTFYHQKLWAAVVERLLPILLLIRQKTNLTEVRRVNTASTISQRDAYKLMLKDYPDVMSIEQMCEILSISTKTGYRILREGKICCLKVGRAYRIPKAHLFTYLCIGCGEVVTA